LTGIFEKWLLVMSQVGGMAAPTYRVSLGDMAPAQEACGSFRQGPVEPEAMMIKHENQAAARKEPLTW